MVGEGYRVIGDVLEWASHVFDDEGGPGRAAGSGFLTVAQLPDSLSDCSQRLDLRRRTTSRLRARTHCSRVAEGRRGYR